MIPLPNIAYVDADLLLTSAAIFIVFFIFEQRGRRAINQMFGKYLTPEVAKHVMDMQEQGQLGLGGTRRTATIMFGDIRGFTTISEGMEPDALAAARAGFEIQEWIQEYRAAHPEEQAAFGFGISSGELVAGMMDSQERMEYTVIGDPVREADELCATALANEVAISESTNELLKDCGVEVLDKGLVTVKGKTDQIHMYTVTGFVEEPAAVA